MAGFDRDVHPAGALLLAHGKAEIWEHSQAVAAEIAGLAARFGLDAEVCRTAALCHDVGGIMPAAEMLRIARDEGWGIDPAEERYPFLLHQRFSVRLCRERLRIADEAVLDAVGCHSTLRAGATAVDMALFLADKLAWDQPGTPPFEGVVRGALDGGLEAACLAYLDYVTDNGMLLMPHGWLVAAHAWLKENVR